MAANATELPNPFTPLAFLPPALAAQYEVSRYMYAGTLGAYLWDIALNLDSDYKLLFKHRVRFPTIVYFSSRIFALSYILTSLVFQVGNVPNCNALQLSLGICCLLAQSCTAMLFFLRVIAVWHPNKIIFAIFFLLWLAVPGTGVTIPIGIRGGHIGTSMQCINEQVNGYTESTVIVGLINDSAVFFAINYRILAYTTASKGYKGMASTFFGGGQMSKLSRALLQGGQHFYLIALFSNVVLLLFVKLPSFPPVYKAMMSPPTVAITNAMACLVFRKIKFGLITMDGTTLEGKGPTVTIGGGRGFRIGHRDPLDTVADLGTNSIFPLEVRVEREVESGKDETTLNDSNAKNDPMFP